MIHYKCSRHMPEYGWMDKLLVTLLNMEAVLMRQLKQNAQSKGTITMNLIMRAAIYEEHIEYRGVGPC